jgi:hypothetical protein
MSRKKAPNRAELSENLMHWANDDSIKASPDFIFRVIDAACSRPAPIVPHAPARTFADLLYEKIPENELDRMIESAFHDVLEVYLTFKDSG